MEGVALVLEKKSFIIYEELHILVDLLIFEAKFDYLN